MARFTVKDLREIVDRANERYPRETPNYYGHHKRFLINKAYGGYQIQEYSETGSSVREVTHGHYSARECAAKFHEYLWENY